MAAPTLPKLLKQNYEKYGGKKVAMRVKEFGIWQTYTWKDYYQKVKHFSLGLISLGLEAGDKVAILGENKPQWYWAELAVQAAGGVVIGIFTDCMPHEVKFYVEHSDSKFVIAHDQEQVDKLLQIKEELPLLKKVIYWDPKGVWNYEDPILISFDKVIELGKEYEEHHPGVFEENVERGSGEDLAVFCYTSGTTGLPKAAMLKHNAAIQAGRSWWNVDRWREDEQYVSFLPPAWITEQGLGIAGSLVSGMEVSFPEEPETVQENIREIGAQILFWGPRNWESVNRLIQAKIIDTTWFNRFLYHLFLPVGYKVTDLQAARHKVNWFWRLLYSVAQWMVFRDLRDKVGLSKIRAAYTAAAPISPDVIRFFRAIGVNIKQLYGGSEQGLVTLHRGDDVRPETSGPVMPGVEVRLSEDGEIIVKGENLFSGYYKSPEATQEKLKSGWYYTGDFGHITEDGHLIVMDRMSDLRQLSGGQMFSPQYAEIRLRFSPYIKDALAVGAEDKAYVSAIVNIDIDNVGRWAEARRIAYTTFTDLSQKPEVIDLIRKEIQRINRTLPEWARIKKFANLHREFDADEAELTRTRKIKRTFVEERYKDLIDAIYSGAVEMAVEAPITYRDGRKGTIKTAIKINSVEQP
ncbi:MAG TPA: long-chain fatty acid--CoA ligase [Dehalococcoidia bacterium]|nr:long-chain fatty acid--CoA ligase [Dehalococcoidia bacterium]